MIRARWAVLLGVVCLVAACGEKTAPQPAAPVVAADPATQKLYERSCKACHETAAGGAPKTGDAAAWAPRVAQGKTLLLDHTIAGYKAMPPMGMCMECNEEQFVALIEFMSASKLK